MPSCPKCGRPMVGGAPHGTPQETMMAYTKIKKGTISPDHEEAVACMEMQAWIDFACAELGRCAAKEAAERADRMMQEFRNRFIEVENR